MKKNIILGVIILLLSSCGVTLQSVVDNNLTKTYDNPLLVIPYEKHRTLNFSNNLKKNIEEIYSVNNEKVEVILIEQSSKADLTLNSTNDGEMKINNAITEDGKDIIIVFKPLNLQYYNNALQSISYQLIGTDIETRREVWKANFSSSGSFGPSTFARASAQKIYQQLKDDRILK